MKILVGFLLPCVVLFVLVSAAQADQPGMATFITLDATTQGNWAGVYGSDGYSIANVVPAVAPYAEFAPQNQLNWTWAATTTDVRGLEVGSSRMATTWYNNPQFNLDVNFTDGNMHQFALYAIDWDSLGRSETVQVFDATTQALLDSRTLSSFTNGIYLVWNISGHVYFTIADTSYPNAVVSGVFFGGASAPVFSPLPPSTTNPVKDPAGIFDGNGNFSATAYVNEAAAYGTPAMIPERFGNSWTSYHSSISASTLWQPPINYYVNPSNTAETWYYTLGTPQTAAGDFSSSFAQVAYVTNPSVSGSAPGVDGILTLDQSHNLWTGVPQLYWTEYGAGHPDENLSGANSSDPYGTPQQPVAVERAYGASESAGESYMVFQNGEVAMGEGGNSANFPYYFDPFPANFTPTAASVTNNGEFLLVTGWNTSTYQGQLAVIAIGSSQPSGSFWSYEWNENYPGFRNYSLPMFDKLLGVIDLPGMAAPTAVEAVGNWVHDPNAWLPGTSNPGQFPLSTQSNWQCFVNGACASLYDTSGFALVASRYEREVLLINLTPLFNEISQGMFGGSFSQFRANVANTGTGPGQWPPTFAEQPSETPTVVYTMQFNTQVTAISASLYPDDLAFIATDDDTLHVWSTNGIQEGTGTGANASQLYTLSVGNNITRIAHMKHWYPSDSTNGAVRYQYIALSRGDKTVTWIDMSSGTPTVLRVLSDSRLVDPISAEDNNNHGTQSDLLDIADYGASNLKAYRYGPVIEWTESGTPEYGMGPTGTDPFEFEGSYATPTGPFSISGDNVP